MTQYPISVTRFDQTYSLFLEFIKEESDGQEFIGFNEGHMYKAEAYKNEIREKSLVILETSEWDKNMIGSGSIAKLIISVLELKGNNLVETKQKYGPNSLTHRKILDAVKTGNNLAEIESVVYNLFKTKISEAVIIDKLNKLIGKKYSLIAFLFYLKNDRKYLPISTKGFEFAFNEIGCELKLSQKCSWENYSAYLGVIREVKNHLENKIGDPINFIDAHSFLWLIGYRNRLRKWIEDKKIERKEIIFKGFLVNPINSSKNELGTYLGENITENNIDWDKENREKRIKGRRAEELVIEYERIRLNGLGKFELSEKIEDYSKKIGVGFDVLSWNEDATPRYIEVKSSHGNGFIITRNELNKSQKNLNYWIYLVNELKDEVQIKMLKAPSLKNNSYFNLEPKDYYVSFSIKNT
tara:strand:- start:176 stop:1408 length:1233 start_codon:yes stop_codon:yes gene_type:complete